MSNVEVARYLLQAGLPAMQGVVFLDAGDRKMVLLRHESKAIPIESCGLSLAQRFSFFDQAGAPTYRTQPETAGVFAMAVCTGPVRPFGRGHPCSISRVPATHPLVTFSAGRAVNATLNRRLECCDPCLVAF